MHLIQILLPLYDNDGARLPRELFDQVRKELVARFGGMTAYARAPASGLWEGEGGTVHDDLVVHEVMAEDLDVQWWGAYREQLEARFRQETLVVRSQEIRML